MIHVRNVAGELLLELEPPDEGVVQSIKRRIQKETGKSCMQQQLTCDKGIVTAENWKDLRPSELHVIFRQLEYRLDPEVSTAAFTGSEEVLVSLLKAHAHPDSLERGRSGCFRAAEAGHVRILEHLCDAGADVNLPEPRSSQTPLHRAKNVEVVRFLLQAGADIHRGDSKGLTALHLAVLRQATAVVRELISFQAEVNCEAGEKTALMSAADLGDHEAVQLLLGSAASATAFHRGWTALSFAALRGHARVMAQLLKTMHPDTVEGTIWTPLFHAVSSQRVRAVRLLLDGRADPDRRDDDGWTPLHLASSKGNTECVNVLLRARASLDFKNNEGMTALMLAAHLGHCKAVECLSIFKADLDQQAENGNTALIFAVEHDQVSVLRFLLFAGAKKDLRNASGCTAARLASKLKHLDALHWLEH